jgi:3',5'-cyclic AMP phosphodiesterase CpdA
MRTIAHISDVHFGKIDERIAEALLAELNADPPSVMVVSGDMTQRARIEQYKPAGEFLKRLPRPLIVVPGNHDVPLWNVFRRVFLPLQRYRRYITTDMYPQYRDDELMVLGVNSARSFTRLSGWLSRRQIRTIAQRFSQAPPGATRVLVTHHPFIPTSKRPDGDVILRGTPTLLALESARIDVLLAGHLHIAYHDEVRRYHAGTKHSLISIQAGTATSTRLRGEPNAYNRITIERDHVHVSVRAWTGSGYAQSFETNFRKADGIWQRQPATNLQTN